MSVGEEQKRYLLALLARRQRKVIEEEQSRIKESANLRKTLIFSNAGSPFPYFKKRKLIKILLYLHKKSIRKHLLNKVEAQNRCYGKENKDKTVCLLYFKRLYRSIYADSYANPKFLINPSYAGSDDIQVIKNELTTVRRNLKGIYL